MMVLGILDKAYETQEQIEKCDRNLTSYPSYLGRAEVRAFTSNIVYTRNFLILIMIVSKAILEIE
jgi:hypothetical protein